MGTSADFEECMAKFRIDFPEKKVENEPPKLVYGMPGCVGDAGRMDSIMAENKALLQKLCEIYSSSGTVDSSPPKCTYASNFTIRLAKLVQIERANIEILTKIHNAEPEVPTVKYCNKEWKRLLQDFQNASKYPFQFANDREWLPLPSLVHQKPRDEYAPRARAFMELTSRKGLYVGRIDFELFSEKAPKLCENFLAFASGKGPDNRSYQDSAFYQILPGYYVMGGDILKNNGSGVLSIDGEVTFEREKNNLAHTESGLLCTPSSNSDTCDSKFMITVKPLTIIDEKSTVFGRVIRGLEVLNAVFRRMQPNGFPLVAYMWQKRNVHSASSGFCALSGSATDAYRLLGYVQVNCGVKLNDYGTKPCAKVKIPVFISNCGVSKALKKRRSSAGTACVKIQGGNTDKEENYEEGEEE